MALRTLPWLCVALAVAGCENPQLWAQAGADAGDWLTDTHPDRRIVGIDEIVMGDGWDDGVELTVVFTSACRSPRPDCLPQVHRREASYHRDAHGRWRKVG
jgi:hypothetical protein